ncbi:aldehyde dehydrogenase family protein [Cryptosporangium aurantiacum]|uniref:Acyl-CoA reductase n=1 Tax=Cryptosporangium aurantiacum TaxID=134849 RepID=A0A1M7TYN7_9ACTN|nr:aldehyde dehydrogenase family protein [Cryptosporangium aurantiacum]SHN75851.1 Acyl-CoA reductase [Cryptosporangium aurantiacum]
MSVTADHPRTVTIDGSGVETAAHFDVINPATGEPFASAPAVSPQQLDAAVRAADAAYGRWRRDEDARKAALLAAADAVDAAAGELAAILTAEQGKPLQDAATETFLVSLWLRYYANLELGPEIVRDDENGYAEVHRRPLGVVAAITPWNFPLTLAMWKIAPALRAGNTVVIKPSPFTPLATLALGEVLRDVLPPGVLNVVTGPDPLGASLTTHPLVRKISFTGSTATGKKVAAAAADDLKRVTLELGGNDPAIVLPGAPIGDIAAGLFWSGFINNGQTCLAVKRIYVHEEQHDDLVEALAGIARDVRVDEGTAEGVQLGPINNRPQFERVSGLVADAVAHDATVAAGGQALDRPGYFFAPTILANVSDGLAVVDEEQFGPVLPVISYREVDDAVARANSTRYGLTASVWSADPEHAAEVAAEVDAGQVTVNMHGGAVTPDLPFGGHKWSGIGVENGPWGLYGFTETQVLAGPARSA